MGRTGKSDVERRSPEKNPRPSLGSKLSLSWKELQGRLRDLPLLLVLAALSREPGKPGFPRETPSQNCDTVLLSQQWDGYRVGLK